jgi:hypothetical protein
MSANGLLASSLGQASGNWLLPAAAASGADGDCFATDSLTEDYEFSFRVRGRGLKQAFVRLPVDRRVRRRSLLHRNPAWVVQRDFITTREFFPDPFWASVRQDMSTMTLGSASASPVKTQFQRFQHLHARKSTSCTCSVAICYD